MMVITLTGEPAELLVENRVDFGYASGRKKKSISGDSALRALSPACLGSVCLVKESERRAGTCGSTGTCGCESTCGNASTCAVTRGIPSLKIAPNAEIIRDDIDNQYKSVYTEACSSLKTRNNLRNSNFGFGVPESIFS